ncbi:MULTISPECIES: VOC family protein [unclassified Streptococcus]|uniref:VOC family protein n=1 Tax=unclassified Streptococcus TaxID=2608887 RepID=UPI001071C887|nr:MULTISPECIES: VOC family protein [unclassified Streptococcus]MBF0805767.1 VOC family protein [Streptococcus sp. 19428wA2_WM07]TFU28676.1 VOC family protein [Streptococcus sp. WM07]
MIESLGQVMVYVKDIDAAAKFWKEQVGFELVERQENMGMVSYLVAPKKDSQVKIVLQDKAKVAELSPELDLGTPSFLMESTNLEETYQYMLDMGVLVMPIVDLGFMRVFNFSDLEENYFAIREVKHD